MTGLTFAGESSFSLKDSFASSENSLNASDCSLAHYFPDLSGSQQISQSSAIIGHCNGLPSPPDSDTEERDQNLMQGFAALEVLQKFNERTVLSVGTGQVARLYQKEIFHLACSVSKPCLHM